MFEEELQLQEGELVLLITTGVRIEPANTTSDPATAAAPIFHHFPFVETFLASSSISQVSFPLLLDAIER